jgi:hypothetical protein
VHYHKGENYFELDVDVGSSSIARNVVGLAIGYSKSIVVDMGLCLQVKLREFAMDFHAYIHIYIHTSMHLSRKRLWQIPQFFRKEILRLLRHS